MFSLGQSSIFMLHIYPPANLGNEMEMLICLQFSIRSRHHQQTYQIIIKLFFWPKLLNITAKACLALQPKGNKHEQSCEIKSAKNRGLVWWSSLVPISFSTLSHCYLFVIIIVVMKRKSKFVFNSELDFASIFCHFPVHQGSAQLGSLYSTSAAKSWQVSFIFSTILFHFFHLGHWFAPSNVDAFFICAAYLLFMCNTIWVQCQR